MKILKRIAQLLITFLVVYYVAKVLATHWQDAAASLQELNYALAIGSVIVMATAFTWQVKIWHSIIRFYNVQLPFSKAWLKYMRAAVVRYIPGNVWGLAARAYLMGTLGMKKPEALFVMVFESAVLLVSGIIVYFITCAWIVGSVVINTALAILGLSFVVLILYPKVLLRIISYFKKDIRVTILPISFILKIVAMYSLYWLLTGVSVYALLAAVGISSVWYLLIAVGVFAISWVIGFIVLIAPSGMGVREFSMIYFLDKLIPLPIATIVSILARLVFIAGEVVSFAGALLLSRIKKDNTNQT